MLNKILLLILLLALSACSHQPLEPSYRKVLPAVRQTQLTTLNHWEIEGSFSLRQPPQSVVANYEWLQQGDHYDLHIHSALNLVSIKIIGEPNEVHLWRSARHVVEAQNPEELMQAQLGWQLPLSNLQYWIRGLPAPGLYKARYDAYGHLLTLKQAGWTIHYSKYLPHGHYDLPTMLKLTDDQWAAKISIKRWELE